MKAIQKIIDERYRASRLLVRVWIQSVEQARTRFQLLHGFLLVGFVIRGPP